MSPAVCFACGAGKPGAALACPSCRRTPGSDDELAVSLLMTRRYFRADQLAAFADEVRAGSPPALEASTKALLLRCAGAGGSMAFSGGR